MVVFFSENEYKIEILTCRRGRQLLHVDDVMDLVVLEYVVLLGLEVALQPVYGGRELFGVDARVERLVRQHQADGEVLVLAAGHGPRHGGRLAAEPLRAGGGGHRRGGRQLDRFLQPVLQHAQLDGAPAATVAQPRRPREHVRRPAVDLYARPVPGRPAVRGGRGRGRGHGQRQQPPPRPRATDRHRPGRSSVNRQMPGRV